MIARIKTETGFYDSIVFAYFKKGWKSKVIVFNQNYDELVLAKIWLPKRNVFIYNTENDSDWIIKKQVEGYDWVINNISKRFFKTVINQNILDKCKELQATVEYREWFEINNQIDIVGLMECAFDFHDSYIKKMYIESEKQYIHFDTTWGCEILFELDGNIATNLFEEFGRFVAENGDYLMIMDSSIFFDDSLTYWVDDYSVKSNLNLDKSKLYYFCANRVKWKLIIPNEAEEFLI